MPPACRRHDLHDGPGSQQARSSEDTVVKGGWDIDGAWKQGTKAQGANLKDRDAL